MQQLDVDAVDYRALIERELQGRLGAVPEPSVPPAKTDRNVCGS
jgi:hypothetical protein